MVIEDKPQIEAGNLSSSPAISTLQQFTIDKVCERLNKIDVTIALSHNTPFPRPHILSNYTFERRVLTVLPNGSLQGGNCTMACPTCFCTTVEEESDLTGKEVSRTRRWDSCFTIDFSYVHGGSVRSGGGARYRQWMTHKLATWIDQFGTSGCVGCGRCITWCPVGIDITAEVRAIRESETG